MNGEGVMSMSKYRYRRKVGPMAKPRGGPRIPSKPFVDWLWEQRRVLDRDPSRWVTDVAGRATEHAPTRTLAARCGVCERTLHRYMKGLDSNSDPTDVLGRYLVEDILHRAGVDFYSLYPEFEHERDIELEPEAWCDKCLDIVTPLDDRCPWCNTRTDQWRQAA